MWDAHDHPHPGWRMIQAALSSNDHWPYGENLVDTPVDMSLASQLVGAAIAGCWTCQENQFDVVAYGDPRVIGHLIEQAYKVMHRPVGRMVANEWLADDYVVSTLASWYGKRSLPLLKAAASCDYTMLHRMSLALTPADRAEILDSVLETLSVWIVLPQNEMLAAHGGSNSHAGLAAQKVLTAQWEDNDANRV